MEGNRTSFVTRLVVPAGETIALSEALGDRVFFRQAGILRLIRVEPNIFWRPPGHPDRLPADWNIGDLVLQTSRRSYRYDLAALMDAVMGQIGSRDLASAISVVADAIRIDPTKGKDLLPVLSHLTAQLPSATLPLLNFSFEGGDYVSLVHDHAADVAVVLSGEYSEAVR